MSNRTEPRAHCYQVETTSVLNLDKENILLECSNPNEEVNNALSDVDFEKNKYQVHFDTNLGPIKLDLYPDVAPNHVKNIIGLVKTNFYNGINFHRVVPGFVIQAGCPDGVGTGGPGYTINQEFNDKKHVAGTLSMARTNDPNSAGSQFFLCLGDVPYLDSQYTVFGQAADEESLNTILEIGKVETSAHDKPVSDVTIKTATVSAQSL